MASIPGGYTAAKPATHEIQEIFNKVKCAVEKKAGVNHLTTYKVILYKSQVVAGMNYIAKIDIGCEKCIHAKVFQALPHTNAPPQLVAVQTGKTKADEIVTF